MKKILLSPKDINTFTTGNIKKFNDSFNKTREAIFKEISDAIITGSPCPNSTDSHFGEEWLRIYNAIRLTINQIVPTGAKPTEMRYMAGRGNNYDFKLISESSPHRIHEIKLELKRGQSIYDQPQFLSLYATAELVSGEPYPNFCYDNYIIQRPCFRRHSPPDKPTYLRLIYGTEYAKHPFFESLYTADNSGSKADKIERSKIVDISIDDYLKNHAMSGLRLEVLQNRLEAQLNKLFLSWNNTAGKFNIERFSKDDTIIVGKPFLRTSRSGLANTIGVKVKSGNQILALLRWKNHKGVLGPAWQIKMVPHRDL